MHTCLGHNFFLVKKFQNSNCDKIQIVTKNQLGFNLKVTANHAELCTNIDANHACT